jgi:RNA polymerase sigma factor (sigma-70 family)
MAGDSSRDANVDLSWLAPYIHHLRAVALTRHRRLRWVMEIDEVLHRAVLRWAPGEKPPPVGEGLSVRQIGTFSLVCRNVLIDEVRAYARRRKLAEEASYLPGRRESAVETLLSNQDLAESVLSRLQPSAREVLQLRYFEMLSFEEIGRRIGKRADAVRQMHTRAMRTLRDCFKREDLM